MNSDEEGLLQMLEPSALPPCPLTVIKSPSQYKHSSQLNQHKMVEEGGGGSPEVAAHRSEEEEPVSFIQTVTAGGNMSCGVLFSGLLEVQRVG